MNKDAKNFWVVMSIFILGCIFFFCSCASTESMHKSAPTLDAHISSYYWIYMYEWNEIQNGYELIAYSKDTYTITRKHK